MSHGRPWTAMQFAKIHTSFSCQLQVSACRVSHFLDAVFLLKLGEFLQVPLLSMGGHGTLRYQSHFY